MFHVYSMIHDCDFYATPSGKIPCLANGNIIPLVLGIV